MTDGEKILEGQLRECYGRVVYTHKTHEICADILLLKHKRIKFLQIVLSALITGGIITSLADCWKVFASWFSVFCSTVLLALNSYTKDYDLGELAQKHRRISADLWLIREDYLSLLTDLHSGEFAVEALRQRRDDLVQKLHAIYTGAPSTDSSAYKKAQKALKVSEDMTFSESEVDAFLPKELKRTHQP
jgi:hypothetical protein